MWSITLQLAAAAVSCAQHIAISQGSLDVVRTLLEAGADVQARDWWGLSLELTRARARVELAWVCCGSRPVMHAPFIMSFV